MLTTRQAAERINAALDDIKYTARTEAESRRVALMRLLAQIAHEFKRASARAVREGRPLDPVELARVRTLVRQAILQQRDAIAEAGLESEAFVDFVIANLLAVHVGIVGENVSAEAGRRARDEFLQRVRQLRQQSQSEVRLLRRRDLEIPTLATVYAVDAIDAVEQLLSSEDIRDVDAGEVTHDFALLLLGQDIDYARYGLTQSDLTPLRGLATLGAAVVVSEAFNAMRASSWRTIGSLGLVETGRWTPSPRHAGLVTSPDECDTIAGRDGGFGPGRYLVTQWPASPHPYCGCSMTDVRLSDFQGWLTRFQ